MAGKKRKKIYLLYVVLCAAAAFLLIAGFVQRNAAKTYRVACIGDSITYGTGVLQTRDTDSYPALLQALSNGRYLAENYGAGGRTLLEGNKKSYSKTGYLEKIEAEEPDILLVMLGTNDSKPRNWDAAEYEAQYEALVQRLMALPNSPKVYVMIPPAAFPGEDGLAVYNIDPQVIREQLTKIIPRIAEKTGAGLIDLYTPTEGHPEYFTDGVHPNRQGNEVIAHEVYLTISEN